MLPNPLGECIQEFLGYSIATMNLRDGITALVEKIEAIKQVADNYVSVITATRKREEQQRQCETEAETKKLRLAHAIERQRRAEQKQNLCIQWVIGMGTWVAVIAACVYAAIAATQVKDARTQFRKDQRPWIRVNLNPNLVIPVNGEFVVPLDVVNTGKTPARDISGDVWIEILASSAAPELEPVSAKPPAKFATGVMFTNQSVPTPIVRVRWRTDTETEPDPITPDERQRLTTGRAYVATHGRVTYWDVFNIQHWTQFCTFTPLVNTPSPERSSYGAKKCAEYNSVDNN